jgi:hypothetical protein
MKRNMAGIEDTPPSSDDDAGDIASASAATTPSFFQAWQSGAIPKTPVGPFTPFTGKHMGIPPQPFTPVAKVASVVININITVEGGASSSDQVMVSIPSNVPIGSVTFIDHGHGATAPLPKPVGPPPPTPDLGKAASNAPPPKAKADSAPWNMVSKKTRRK